MAPPLRPSSSGIYHLPSQSTALTSSSIVGSSSTNTKSRMNKSRFSVLVFLLALLVWWQFDSGRRSTFSAELLDRLTALTEVGPPTIVNAKQQQQQESQQEQLSLLLLEHQVRDQTAFQHMIHKLMHPSDCRTARALYQKRHDRKDSGFTCLIHVMSRVLVVAVATHRTLVIANDWRSLYEPPNCTYFETPNGTVQQRGFYECLWEPISPCTDQDMVDRNTTLTTKVTNATLDGRWVKDEITPSAGIIPQRPRSTYFDVMYYGSDRVVEAPSWPWKLPNTRNIDVIPDWERRFGRFWIRAQVAHYMWRPNPTFYEEIVARMPTTIEPGTPFIGFHVRYTDNIKDLARDFARDATITRNFQRFMDIAEHVRKEVNPSLHTIYLATDNPDIIKHSTLQTQNNWTFVVQANVERTTSIKFFWYGRGRSKAAAGVATDVEMLRRADFLVGSFQSNVYRLAAELNLAYLSDKYPWSMQRHYSVDVEWYEDA
jgi:hypothetical protein